MAIIRLYKAMQPTDWTPALPTHIWKRKSRQRYC